MSNNNPTCPSDQWPIKAYKNLDFLTSDPARNIRVLCEMTEPGQRLQQANIQDTIVLFGSARTIPTPRAEAELRTIETELNNNTSPSAEQKAQHRRAQRNLRSAKYYDAAAELAEKLTNWSKELPAPNNERFTICSGGGPGIMQAANKGAKDAGGRSIGFGISLPFEQGVNEYVSEELKFEFHYFFTRKYWFVSLAKALVAFPGGFGTLDELFETLTLVQTGKVKKLPPIILYGRAFWESIINFEALVEWGTISEEDIHLIQIVDSVEEAYKAIVQPLEKIL